MQENTSHPLSAEVYVTPAMAEDWLAKRWERQRPLRESHVQRLMADLLAGRFYFTPHPVIFDLRDRLVDGQHRLEACRRTGVGFRTLVVRGVPDEVVPKLGQSQGWSLAALLGLHSEARQFGSQANIKFATQVGAFLYTRLSNKPRRPTDDEALAVVRRFRDSILWALDSCSSKLLSRVAVRAAFVLMHSSRPGQFEFFAEKVRTGVGLGPHDAALTLRDYLMGETSYLRADRAEWQFYKTLRAGEAYVRSEKLQRLQPPKETLGAIHEQMDFFLGSSVKLADELGLLQVAASEAQQQHAQLDGTVRRAAE